MKKITSYNYRKIINLIFLLLSILVLSLMTIVKNSAQGNIMLWEMMLSSSIDGKVRIGAIACCVLFIIVVFACLLTIPRVLKKHNNSYFGVQALISIALSLILIAGKITGVLSTISFVLVGVALLINVLATIYSYNIVKYNYDEIYNYVEEALDSEVVEENDNGDK